MSRVKATAKPDRKGQGEARPKLPRSQKAVIAGLAVLLLLVVGAATTIRTGSGAPSAGAAPRQADRVDVVYFHRTQRCDSCLWTGKVTENVVQTYFVGELKVGKVTFREVDVQKAENAAMVSKYGAAGSSLYLNYVKDGVDSIHHASDTYAFIGNQARFTELLRSKIATGLGQT